MGAGVQQVFALQVEALVRREPLGAHQRRRPAAERPAELVELESEGGVVLRLVPRLLELVQRGDQRLGHEAAAVGAVGQHRAASTKARTLA